MRAAALKLIPVTILAFGLTGAIAFLSYKIGEKNATAAMDVAEFQRAIRVEMEQRFALEHQASADARGAIDKKVDRATEIATKALAKPPASVLVAGKAPIPVQVVGVPTPAPKATEMPNTNPKSGGLLDKLFR